jgi:hypothetical protein
MTEMDAIPAVQRSRFGAATIVHLALSPFLFLVWSGIALLAANVSGRAPDTASGYIPYFAIMIPVFGLGLGAWIWLLRAFMRWSRTGSTGLLPNWSYPMFWAVGSFVLLRLMFAFRSWQFSQGL